MRYLDAFTHSISVLQWLLNAETSHPTSSPPHRLTRFFTTLHSALRNPSRAVLQFYPTSDDQIQLITSIAQRAGFGGGLVVDYPNSKKARKVFLCLFVGNGGSAQVPRGLEGDDVATAAAEDEDAKVNAKFEGRRQRESRRERNGKQKVIKGGKDWILRKKDVRCICLSYPSHPPLPPLLLLTTLELLVIPKTRKGGCASRLQIHGPQKKGNILECLFINPSASRGNESPRTINMGESRARGSSSWSLLLCSEGSLFCASAF